MARGRPLLKTSHQPVGLLKCLPPNAEYIQDWTMLISGDMVLVLREGKRESSGQVDARNDDGFVLWLHVAGGAGRRRFSRKDGSMVWRVPAQK